MRWRKSQILKGVTKILLKIMGAIAPTAPILTKSLMSQPQVAQADFAATKRDHLTSLQRPEAWEYIVHNLIFFFLFISRSDL